MTDEEKYAKEQVYLISELLRKNGIAFKEIMVNQESWCSSLKSGPANTPWKAVLIAQDGSMYRIPRILGDLDTYLLQLLNSVGEQIREKQEQDANVKLAVEKLGKKQ